jgi:hypothetical protein
MKLSKPMNQCASLLRTNNHDCFISKQSIAYFKKRFLVFLPRINCFFARFTEFYYDMDILKMPVTEAARTVIVKILCFDAVKDSFNHVYFSEEKNFFFST